MAIGQKGTNLRQVIQVILNMNWEDEEDIHNNNTVPGNVCTYKTKYYRKHISIFMFASKFRPTSKEQHHQPNSDYSFLFPHLSWW